MEFTNINPIHQQSTYSNSTLKKLTHQFNGRVIHTFAHLPEQGRVLEVAKRVLIAVSAPFVYLSLGLGFLTLGILNKISKKKTRQNGLPKNQELHQRESTKEIKQPIKLSDLNQISSIPPAYIPLENPASTYESLKALKAGIESLQNSSEVLDFELDLSNKSLSKDLDDLCEFIKKDTFLKKLKLNDVTDMDGNKFMQLLHALEENLSINTVEVKTTKPILSPEDIMSIFTQSDHTGFGEISLETGSKSSSKLKMEGRYKHNSDSLNKGNAILTIIFT
jgi:hypothetical protein